jgi:hypothetical protein
MYAGQKISRSGRSLSGRMGESFPLSSAGRAGSLRRFEEPWQVRPPSWRLQDTQAKATGDRLIRISQ